MQQCDVCEESFLSPAPLRISLSQANNGDILVYASNQGRNICIIKRMIVCRRSNVGTSWLYIREGGFFDFEIGGERIEQGSTQLKFRASGNNVISARAQAEYFEVTGRAVSCEFVPEG